MTERYEITLDSQLGPRAGVLLLEINGDRVGGTLSILKKELPVSGEKTGENEVVLRHEVHTLDNRFYCVTTLRFDGTGVSGFIDIGKIRMSLCGEKQAEPADTDSGKEAAHEG